MSDQSAPINDSLPNQASSVGVNPAEPVSSQETDQYGRQLYNIKCSQCGNDAQVPFMPNSGRPVYCRQCYLEQRRGRRNRNSFSAKNRR